jgi:hypothetical protein
LRLNLRFAVANHRFEFHKRRQFFVLNDKLGLDLISDALPFGRLWYTKPDDAVGYAKFRSRSHHAVIRVYDAAGNVIENARAQGRFQRVVKFDSHHLDFPLKSISR